MQHINSRKGHMLIFVVHDLTSKTMYARHKKHKTQYHLTPKYFTLFVDDLFINRDLTTNNLSIDNYYGERLWEEGKWISRSKYTIDHVIETLEDLLDKYEYKGR